MYGDPSQEALLFCILKCENIVLNVITGFRQFIYKEGITLDIILR